MQMPRKNANKESLFEKEVMKERVRTFANVQNCCNAGARYGLWQKA